MEIDDDLESTGHSSVPPQLEESSKEPTYWEVVGNFFHHMALSLEKPVHAGSAAILRAILTPIRPGEEGNASTHSAELAMRVGACAFHLFFSPLTITLFTLGNSLHLIGNSCIGKPFTYFKGEGEESADPNHFRVLTLNACMFWGGLPIPFGGVSTPEARIKQLAELIRQSGADVVCLQEMTFGPSVDLFQELRKEFPHCHTRIGPNPMRMESGLCIISKFPIENAHFVPFPDPGGIKRGAFFIETPSQIIVNTHLDPFSCGVRKEQIEIIHREIARLREMTGKPALLLGDLNIDRLNHPKEYQEAIGSRPEIHDPYRVAHPDLSEETATCTNHLISHRLGKEPPEVPFEMVDYALFYGDREEMEFRVNLVDTFSLDAPGEAVSDHRGILLEVQTID